MNKNKRVLEDIMSVIVLMISIIWDYCVEMSMTIYRVFKNDNKSHVYTSIENSSNERVENEGHDMGGSYQYGVDTHDYDPRIDPKYNHHSHIPRCSSSGNDEASYDENSNDEVSYDEVSYDDDQNEEGLTWRDKFAGWLP